MKTPSATRFKNQAGEANAEFARRVVTLFPEGVVAVQVQGKVSPKNLLEEERACISRATDRRIENFAAGRLCARAALLELGFPESPLLPGPDGVPTWPPGVMGTISHTKGYSVAVVGLSSKFAGLGVDAERARLMTPLWPSVFSPKEIAFLDTLDGARQAQMSTVMFTAKEAWFKCKYPFTHSWLGFKQVEIGLTDETFHVTLCERVNLYLPASRPASDRYMCDGDLIASGIAVETSRWLDSSYDRNS